MEPVSGTLAAVLGALGGALAYITSLVGEGWTRYFILLAGLFVDNQIGNFTGLYAMEGLISFIISNIFGIQGFFFPIYYGLSSLLLIFVLAPILLFLFGTAIKG